MNRSVINETVFNVESGQKSKIACRCKADFGGLSLFVGCKWKLVESNCPTVLFSLASDSAEFDDSFGNATFTGDSFQEVETTSIPTVTNSTQNVTMSSLEAELESLKQELEQVKEQFNNRKQIQVVKGLNSVQFHP